MNNGKQASLEDIREELQIANRLMVLALVRSGVQQKDIAATIGVSNSLVCRMFPKGLLRRVTQSSKNDAASVES